ncbi:MAG TPA: RNA methyltransferase [Candidatus Cloacimonadota bacterium]|nr:RNA methyltransferase [Candidatus Cloacimonadota bacterium]
MPDFLSKNRVSELAALKQKKQRRAQGLCVLEGLRLITQLAADGILPKEVFLLDGEEALPALASVPAFICDQRAMERICDTEHPQGLAALYELPKSDFKGFRRAFYLDGISDPGNLGTIFRLAMAFGIDAVLLSEGCADPASPKVIRSSLGAVYKVPYAQMNPIALKLPGLKVVGTSAEGDTALHDFQPPARAPMLIVIGSEAHGVTPEIARRCEQTLRIEMAPGMESLNAAVAAGIVAHHLWVESLTS